MQVSRRSNVPSQSEEEDVQVEWGWCVGGWCLCSLGRKVSVVQWAQRLARQLQNVLRLPSTLFLRFAVFWPLYCEQQSLFGFRATWAFSNRERSALQVAVLWNIQLSQIHLDVYVLCLIISSSRRVSGRFFFFPKITPHSVVWLVFLFCFVFFLSHCYFWQRNMVEWLKCIFKLLGD